MHTENSAQQKPQTPLPGVLNCQTPSCLPLFWVEAHAYVLVPCSTAYAKTFYGSLTGKKSGCNHQSPWGQRQTLMALLKLRQSGLLILGRWMVVKRLENYWKPPTLQQYIPQLLQPASSCLVPSCLTGSLRPGFSYWVPRLRHIPGSWYSGVGFLSHDRLFYGAFWDLPSAACLDPALNCNSTLQSQNSASVSFLLVWLNFSVWGLLTASCLLLTLIMLPGLNPKPIFT